jgi:hypothetical protein
MAASPSWRGLAELRTDARQLLTLLNEALARGQSSPPDLAAARSTLGPPLERIKAAGAVLHRRGIRRGERARSCRTWTGSARPLNASTRYFGRGVPNLTRPQERAPAESGAVSPDSGAT